MDSLRSSLEFLNLKKCLKILLYVSLSLALAPLLILQITRLIIPVAGERGSELLTPLPPLPEDHAATVIENLHFDFDEKANQTLETCLRYGNLPKKECEALLQRFSKPLKKFDQWLASTSKYGLKPSPALDRHSRRPLQLTLLEEPPPYIRYIKLVKLLILRMYTAIQAQNQNEVLRNWEAAIDVSRFVGRFANLVSEVISYANLRIALNAVVNSIPPAESVKYPFETFLPAPEELVKNMELAIGGEWLLQENFIVRELSMDFVNGEKTPRYSEQNMKKQRLASFLGIYDQKHTLGLISEEFVKLNQQLKSKELRSKYFSSEYYEEGWPFLISLMHNPEGRILASLSQASVRKYVEKTDSMIDKISSFQVVMAERRYFAKKGRWSRKHEDLVPEFLPKWPVSVVNGKEINLKVQRN